MGCLLSRRCWLLLLALICLGGCVYQGPRATPDEVREYESRLVGRAFRYRASLWRRVVSVGYHLLQYIPPRFRQGNYPYVGLLVVDADEQVRSAFGLPEGRYPVIVEKVEGTSCEKLDVEPGTVLLAVNGYRVKSCQEYQKVLSTLIPGRFVQFDFWSEGRIFPRMVKVDSRPRQVDFYMSSDAEINAMATPNAVIVTYGMMRFLQSDDELAVVLGHEIAHILLAHHVQHMGVDLVSGLFGTILSNKLEEVLPGLGSVLAGMGRDAVTSGYSRELEMQADYWGLYLAYRAGYDIDVGKDIWERFAVEVPESMIESFWRTHPTSLERRAYIEKIVRQFKAGIFPDDGNTKD